MIYLPVVAFISIGFWLNDPVNLLMNSVVTILTFLITIKSYKRLTSIYLENILLYCISIILLISTLINDVNIKLALIGNYQRNNGIFFYLSIAIIFHLASTGTVKTRDFIYKTFSWLLLVACIYGYLQIFDLDPISWLKAYDGVQLTLGNPNFAGALIGLLFALPINILLRENTKYKFLSIFILIALAPLAIGTKSLQTFLIILIVTITQIVIVKYEHTSKFIQILKQKSSFKFYISGIVCALTVVAFSFKQNLLEITRHFVIEGNVGERLGYWQLATKIFLEHAFYGIGPDQFQRYAGEYRSRKQILEEGVFTLPDRAHNVFLDISVSGGILAGLLYLSFLYLVIKRIIVISRLNEKSVSLKEFAFVTSIFLGYTFQSLISPDQIILSIIGMIAGGCIVNIYNRETNQSAIGSPSKKVASKKSLKLRLPIFLLSVSSLFLSSIIWCQAIVFDAKAFRILNNGSASPNEILKLLNSWENVEVAEKFGVLLYNSNYDCVLISQIADLMVKNDNRSAQGYYLRALCNYQANNLVRAGKDINSALDFDPLNPEYQKLSIEIIRLLTE